MLIVTIKNIFGLITPKLILKQLLASYSLISLKNSNTGQNALCKPSTFADQKLDKKLVSNGRLGVFGVGYSNTFEN